jgi:hypothetical protein
MSRILNTTLAIILLSLAAVGTADARGVHRHRATHHRHLGLRQPMTPQFNDPGPKLWVPQPGNAVEQLSPLGAQRAR